MELNEKLEPVYIFLAIILGLLLSNIKILTNLGDPILTLSLALMLFALFLEIPLKDIKKSFTNTKYTTISLLINFLWTPLFGYFLAKIFLTGSVDLEIGFFMLILTPCTDWYLLFTKIAKGDVSLNLSILPVNLILQLILLPTYLLIFYSKTNTLNILNLGYSLLIFIIIPFTLAQIFKKINKKHVNLIKNKIIDFQMLFLAIAIFALFLSQGENLFTNINTLYTLFIPIILFFTVNFLLDFIISKQVKFKYSEYASLSLTTLARNSPLALAIAVKSFPNNQLIPLALVIGPLIELPVLYIISKTLLKIKKYYK